jgi:polyisoprenoid-binding protein YceI
MKTAIVTTVITTLISINCLAVDPNSEKSYSQNYSQTSYAEAAKSENFVRFDMKSTKFGLVTTSFSGFAKKFSVSGTVTGNGSVDKISNAKLSFNVSDMDTDVDSRNEKMWNLCFSYKEHPTIEITLDTPIDINQNDQIVTAQLSLRGYSKPIKVTLNATTEGSGGYFVEGESDVSLKSLEIPDPSIVIAKVKDEIHLQFKVHITK